MLPLLFSAMLAAASPTASDPLFVMEPAPGLHVLGSAQRFGAANIGWVALNDHIVIIGAPHPELVAAALKEIQKATPKPIRSAILTHIRAGEVEAARILAREGIEVVAQREAAKLLRAGLKGPEAVQLRIREFDDRLVLGEGRNRLEVLAEGRIGGAGDAVVYLPEPQALFAGALCYHGPRAELSGIDTYDWLRVLRQVRALPCRTVVPGFGTPGDGSILERQERYLRELRRQVGHVIAQARPLEDVVKEVRITPGYLVWMPYDNPTREDIEHVYRELTIPRAPFGTRGLSHDDSKPKALVLIADRPHDPGHIEAGLARALESAGIDPYICVDFRALSAENLKRVRLLVILRDGAIWPEGGDKPGVSWMTTEQERAIVGFVERGGGLLALHNATALYPESGPYLSLLAGVYKGHGPLERFHVTVTDRDHPVTRGVTDFHVADEQHTPVPDLARVHVVLENRSDEGKSAAAGWVRSVGRGRVCYLANGHTREVQEHPEFQKLLRNSALWCLGRDEAQGGAR